MADILELIAHSREVGLKGLTPPLTSEEAAAKGLIFGLPIGTSKGFMMDGRNFEHFLSRQQAELAQAGGG